MGYVDWNQDSSGLKPNELARSETHRVVLVEKVPSASFQILLEGLLNKHLVCVWLSL